MNSAKKFLSKVEKDLSKNKTPELEKQKKELQADIVYYNVLQSVLKLTLNSIYGIMANKYSPFVDIDNIFSYFLQQIFHIHAI